MAISPRRVVLHPGTRGARVGKGVAEPDPEPPEGIRDQSGREGSLQALSRPDLGHIEPFGRIPMTKATDNPTSTRRRFLRLAASTAAATAFLAAPTLAGATSAIPAAPAVPDPAVALGWKWRAAYRRLIKSWDARDNAETAIRDGGEDVPLHPFTVVGNQWCSSAGSIMAACLQPDGPGTEEGKALVAAFRRKVRAYWRWRRDAGLRPFDREAEEAKRAERAVIRALAATHATTFGGIAAKLYVIRDDFRDGESDFSHAILRSALHDAERLSGKVVWT